MKIKLLISALIVSMSLGCSILPEKINRFPEKDSVTTTGVGEAIYTYDKQGKVYIDYMNAKATNHTDSVKQELIYSGYSNGELKITYREYMNHFARESFFQLATYEYSIPGSTIISFKGAEVEILDANNVQIKYRVLKGFREEQLEPLK